MQNTYAQKQKTAQKKDASTAAAVLDTSSQSEGLQRKADIANNAAQREETPRPNNTGMPDNLKSGIESLSGFSMDDVRVHYNSSKPATVQALAYTQGTDIHVAPGQEKHLPHEAWHVAQQMAGRVSPTTNINGMPVNDNAGLEHEADVMGEKAVGQKYSINKKTYNTSIKNDAIQNYSFRQMNSNTNQNVMQCVSIKVYDEIVLADQDPSKSGTTSIPSVVNKINTISSSVPAATPAEDFSIPSRRRSASAPPIVNKANSVMFPVPATPPTTPAGDFSIPSRRRSASVPPSINPPDYFKSKIKEALNKIKDEYYVQKLLHFSHSTGVSITPPIDDLGSGWKNGSLDGNGNFILAIDLNERMFWGTPNDYETSGPKPHAPVYLTLLHELGHAYQYYLNIENSTTNYHFFSDSSTYPIFFKLSDKTKERLKKYPLFLEALKDLNTRSGRLRLYNALYYYGIKDPTNKIRTLQDMNEHEARENTIIEILNTIEKIALFGFNIDHDCDNMFMNEIPYTSAHYLPKRKHYTHCYDPKQFPDVNCWKLLVFLEENGITSEDNAITKKNDIMHFFEHLSTTGVDISSLLITIKKASLFKSFFEGYKKIVLEEVNTAKNKEYSIVLKKYYFSQCAQEIMINEINQWKPETELANLLKEELTELKKLNKLTELKEKLAKIKERYGFDDNNLIILLQRFNRDLSNFCYPQPQQK